MSAKPVGSAVGKPEPMGIIPGSVTFSTDGGSAPEVLLELTRTEAGKPVNVTGMPNFAVREITKHRLRSAGLRSSEFWLCSFCACVGSALALWAASPLDMAGAMLLGLATASYAWSRGKAKGRSVVQGKL